MGREERANPNNQKDATPRLDGIVDARGRKLEVGDEIIFNAGGPIYFRVVDIKPCLRPDAPPGMMELVISAVPHFYTPRGVPQVEFIRTRTAEECGPLPIALAPDMQIEGDKPLVTP